MAQAHVALLTDVLDALAILSPTSFSLGDQVIDTQAEPPLPPAPGQEIPQNPLISQLEHTLYSEAYTHRFEGKPRTPLILQNADGDLTAALSKANTSRERWEPDWQITEVMPTGQVVAGKGGATRTLWAGEFITQDGPGTRPREGAIITIFVPRESTTVQPGFYHAFGEEASGHDDAADVVRFYWNVSAQGAPALVEGVTRKLNRFRTPFRFKCASRREHCSRIDTAVLYVNKRHYRITAEALVPVYTELTSYLAPETPLFAHPLAPGLAFAEEPGTGESFGSYCCRIVAEGIWRAYVQGEQSVEAWLDAIRAQFEGYDLDFRRPYLRPGSVDTYVFPNYEQVSADVTGG